MSAPAMEPGTLLAHALSNVDRLLRNETNRSRHITLASIRSDLAEGIAHLGSPAEEMREAS